MIKNPTFRQVIGKVSFSAVAFALAAACGLQTVPVHAMGSEPACQQVSMPVTLSATDKTVYSVAGQLCARGSLKGKTVQLLTHGLTYDHRYWDWPQSPQAYSYVRSATNAGYATLAIDRLGDGASSHPTDGSTVTTISGGYVLHQIIQKLRAGKVGSTSFSKVISVGHSFGSASVGYEAGTYRDVDGVIITGYLHDTSPATLAAFSTAIYPARLDPAFANAGFNDTYLTTQPGRRAEFFFNTNVDPAVVVKDEQIKQTGTTGELDAAAFEQANAATNRIHVPVLIVMGDSDAIFCDVAAGLSCATSSALLAREQSHFSTEARLQAYVLRNSGHDINLHRNAGQWFSTANAWAASHVK